MKGNKKNNNQKALQDSNTCVAYGLDRYAWNQGYNAKYDFQVFENEEPALVARGGVSRMLQKVRG